MSKTSHNLNQAVAEFVEAFQKYQAATAKMNQSLRRFAGHTQSLYEPLNSILQASGAASTQSGA
ncbi:hypothetical protein [Propionivibrio limicola]|uniref:hypothetical protein n=1 Tax=Propionivibrio limicola TaxID=167645 RepID=UPI001290AD4F|nr:hypothetical protein [Propionivibrio limicola]